MNLPVAIRAARQAGTIMLRHMDRLDTLKVEPKKANDFVTEVDFKAEQAIVETIMEFYPNHAILAEERGAVGDSDFLWIIDPLDGTTNFIHGIPQFAVSIALQIKGRLELAVVFNPVTNEMFTAQRGGGAFLNDRRIRVSKRNGLPGALIGTGVPFTEFDDADAYFNMLRSVVMKTSGIRRPGAAALDLAYVAAGRFDGFWELNLKPWDIAAGALLVREAGGLVGSLIGSETHMEHGNIVAGSPKVFAALLKELQPHLTENMKR